MYRKAGNFPWVLIFAISQTVYGVTKIKTAIVYSNKNSKVGSFEIAKIKITKIISHNFTLKPQKISSAKISCYTVLDFSILHFLCSLHFWCVTFMFQDNHARNIIYYLLFELNRFISHVVAMISQSQLTPCAFLSGTPEQSQSCAHSDLSHPSLTRVPDKRREFRSEFDSTGLEFESRQGQG